MAVHKKINWKRFFGYAWEHNQYKSSGVKMLKPYGLKTKFGMLPGVFSVRKHRDGSWTKRGEFAVRSTGLYRHLPYRRGVAKKDQKTLEYVRNSELPEIDGQPLIKQSDAIIKREITANTEAIKNSLTKELHKTTKRLKKGATT